MAFAVQDIGRRVAGSLRAMRRDRGGATAIEFSLLALPFALLAFAILETTVSFAAQQVITNAADDIGRQVRTGKLTLANTTKQQMRDKICSEISVLTGSACSGLVWDLQSYGSFSAVPKTIPRNPSGDIDDTAFGYNPGEAGSIISLRIFYRWPVMIDMMKSSMANLPNNKTLLYASVTWQNEPF